MIEPETNQDDLGFSFTAMACEGEVRICGYSPTDADRLARLVIGEVRRIEQKYSRYRADSVVSRINDAAGTGPVEIDAETSGLLDYAGHLHALSGGKFDITSGVLRRAWDFKRGRLPRPGEIEKILPCIGFQHICREGDRVGLAKAGMELDFGGFGKEYAIDRAAALLLDAGVCHGLLNLGGDVRVVGPRPDGQLWSLGVRHPRSPDAVIASVELGSGALATSGDYERFFERDGVRYCHILDPQTGWPVAQWQSISVAAPLCLGAGALTTIAMLMGKGAIRFLNSQAASYVAVDAAGKVLHNLN